MKLVRTKQNKMKLEQKSPLLVEKKTTSMNLRVTYGDRERVVLRAQQGWLWSV